MADRGIQLGSVAAGLTVAIAAVIPLLWITMSPIQEAAPVDNVPPATPVTTAIVETPGPGGITAEDSTTRTIVVERPAVRVDELSPAIVRVLETAGNLQDEASSRLALPGSVASVLIENDVVLSVTDDGSSVAP